MSGKQLIGFWVFLTLIMFVVSGFNFWVIPVFSLFFSAIFLLILAYRILRCDPFEYEEFRRMIKEKIERRKSFLRFMNKGKQKV